MENFQTEEQQVEAIKSFWQKNGNSIIAGTLIGFAGFIGFNYYKDSKYDQEVALTDSYQQLLDSAMRKESGFADKAKSFVEANPESSFAALTALAQAEQAVSHQDFAGAEQHLASAKSLANLAGIKAIASVRLARVQIQQEKFDDALASLDFEVPAGFVAAVEETKGDAYVLQGKKELARDSYQKAIDADGLAANPTLQMKLDDLAQSITVAN